MDRASYPAVDDEFHAGYGLSFIRRQEQRCMGNVPSGSHSLHWNHFAAPANHLVDVAAISRWDVMFNLGCVHQAGQNTIGSNPLVGVLNGNLLC